MGRVKKESLSDRISFIKCEREDVVSQTFRPVLGLGFEGMLSVVPGG